MSQEFWLLRIHPSICRRAHRPLLKPQADTNGKKSPSVQEFLSLPSPLQYSGKMNEEKSNFSSHVPLDHHGCRSLMLLCTFAIPNPNLFTTQQRGLWATSKVLSLTSWKFQFMPSLLMKERERVKQFYQLVSIG